MSQINRLSNGGRIDRNKVLNFTFNGAGQYPCSAARARRQDCRVSR